MTCVCCKIIESIVKDDLLDHLRRNKLIADSQHGFMKNRSCATNLLDFLEQVTKAVDSGKDVDVIYLDFAKAFDKVPTERLLRKLKAHGVEGQVAEWIKAWLTQRKQRVVIRGVLGPVLFLLFINDLDMAATSRQILEKLRMTQRFPK